MYIQKIESDLATVLLSVVELALLTQACGAFTVKNGTSAEQALVESMGAGFHGAAMAASSIDVLLGEDVDRVQRQWQRNGLLRAADVSIIHHVKTLDELRETLVGKDVFVDAAYYEGFGTVKAVLSDGAVQVEAVHTGACIVVGTDEVVELICLVEVEIGDGLWRLIDDLLRLIDVVKKKIFIVNRVDVIQRGHEGYPD